MLLSEFAMIVYAVDGAWIEEENAEEPKQALLLRIKSNTSCRVSDSNEDIQQPTINLRL